ncbi:MAG: hypothetical protein JRN58_04270 [Nitrososphaerota archaeon]|nr:hypothetical protein [Nitrososphaerota archaeon]MDG6978280.1 hypothetical protein [Nitrososphaerota archaeon]
MEGRNEKTAHPETTSMARGRTRVTARKAPDESTPAGAEAIATDRASSRTTAGRTSA